MNKYLKVGDEVMLLASSQYVKKGAADNPLGVVGVVIEKTFFTLRVKWPECYNTYFLEDYDFVLIKESEKPSLKEGDCIKLENLTERDAKKLREINASKRFGLWRNRGGYKCLLWQEGDWTWAGDSLGQREVTIDYALSCKEYDNV